MSGPNAPYNYSASFWTSTFLDSFWPSGRDRDSPTRLSSKSKAVPGAARFHKFWGMGWTGSIAFVQFWGRF